jgi:hypothetical protein
MFTLYNEAELLALIENQVEENINLDYKAGDSLQLSEGKKKEVSKDVSAFANSDGGTLIYGMKEFDDATKRHFPERIDPINRLNISKEWLEQVINSNVKPRINGVLIKPIVLSSSNAVYVVHIPKSTTAHQASDKRYYKRFNFESVAMEDYEVKDIINRQTMPVLSVQAGPLTITRSDGMANLVSIPFTVGNSSIRVAKDVKVVIEIQEPNNCDIVAVTDLTDLSHLNHDRKVFCSAYDARIYKGLNIQVGIVAFRFLNDSTSVRFKLTMYADNMEPIMSEFEINEVGDQVVCLQR